MKAFTFLCLLLLPSLGGCDRDEGIRTGDMFRYEIYFDFGNQQFSKSEVEITAELEKVANENFQFGKDRELGWHVMKIFKWEGDTLFGPVLVGGVVEEKIKYKGQPLEYEYYRLLRLNHNDIDTLHVINTFEVNEKNYFDLHGIAIFYNRELISSFNWLPGDSKTDSSLIYFFRDGKLVFTRKTPINLAPWIVQLPKQLPENNE